MYIRVSLIFFLFLFHYLYFALSYADENIQPLMIQNDEGLAAIVNPLNSTCYDWKGDIIP